MRTLLVLLALASIAGCATLEPAPADAASRETPAADTPCAVSEVALLDWTSPQEPQADAAEEIAFEVPNGTRAIASTWTQPTGAGAYLALVRDPEGVDVARHQRNQGVYAPGTSFTMYENMDVDNLDGTTPPPGPYTFHVELDGAVEGGAWLITAEVCA